MFIDVGIHLGVGGRRRRWSPGDSSVLVARQPFKHESHVTGGNRGIFNARRRGAQYRIQREAVTMVTGYVTLVIDGYVNA